MLDIIQDADVKKERFLSMNEEYWKGNGRIKAFIRPRIAKAKEEWEEAEEQIEHFIDYMRA